MKVFKFGGASVKDADAVRNVAAILKQHENNDIVVVLSAMGKTTNALERLVDAFCHKKENRNEIQNEIKKYHFDILENLFPDKKHLVYNDIQKVFSDLDIAVSGEPRHSYDCEYDQIVSIGEIVSSKIVSAYLNEVNVKNKWWDVRDLIQTDATYREGKVNWEITEKRIQETIVPYFNVSPLEREKGRIIVTQGFIGATPEHHTTTLGREGSDYTAAIIAFSADAKDVTIWKDVPGVLNADPKWFDETKKIEQLSYQDAIELSYYGATVIHPKTIKPLQNKTIHLYVKSFLVPEEKGTEITEVQSPLPIPCFIFKINQVLISISPKDFSFIVEENLSDIFKLFAEHQVKINVIQNSAISFSVSADNDATKIPQLTKTLQQNFRVLYNDNLELITIRYYDQATIDRVCIGKAILLEQKSRYTVQLVVKNL